MFQSIWGVAEASCLHEMTELTNVSVAQQPPVLVADVSTSSLAFDKLDEYCQKICFQDKCSHFGQHVSLVHTQPAHYYDNKFELIRILKYYDWHNSYQSPDLYHLTPPPQISPLLVG